MWEEFTGDGEFLVQRASNAENVSIWRRHHDTIIIIIIIIIIIVIIIIFKYYYRTGSNGPAYIIAKWLIVHVNTSTE